MMNSHDIPSSGGCVLIERVGRQIFDILPEGGPILVIRDSSGNCWPSDSARFASLNLSETVFADICAKIDDGAEPVVSSINNSSIVGVQLATDRTKCGYVLIVLPGCNSESCHSNIELIEILLGQIGLIAKLIEKNDMLYELQARQIGEYAHSNVPSN
jgi:hypothetical protein